MNLNEGSGPCSTPNLEERPWSRKIGSATP
jgi:hypothetical protein